MTQRKAATDKPVTPKAAIVRRGKTIAKKKAAFVDGPALNAMRPMLGISHPRYDVLFQILAAEVGETREMVAKPICTISDRFPYAETQSKRLEMAGFEPKVMSTFGGADDQFIIDQIRALDPKEVAEIVIVAADRDYVKCLREKAAQGIKIFWLGVLGPARDGFPMIASDLEEIFECKEFSFIDLTQYKERLMRTPWVDRPRPEVKPIPPPLPEPTPPSPFKVIEITMKMTVKEDRAPAIQHAVGSLMANVSRLDGVTGHETTIKVH